MVLKPVDIIFPVIRTEDEWTAILDETKKLIILDVYTEWSGPCEALVPFFQKVQFENDQDVQIIRVAVDEIEELDLYKNMSSPQFLLYIRKMKLAHIKGANLPLIESTYTEKLDIEKMGLEQKPMEEDFIVRNPSKLFFSDYEDGLEHTLAIIKPDAMEPSVRDAILFQIKRSRFNILRAKKIWFTMNQAEEFYEIHKGKPVFTTLCNFLTSGPVLALVVSKANAIKAFLELAGPKNPQKAKVSAMKSIRAEYGVDTTMNAIYCSENLAVMKKDIDWVFESDDFINYPYDLLEKASHGAEKCIVVIKPEANRPEIVDKIIQILVWNKIQIQKKEEIVLTSEQISILFSSHTDKEYYPKLLAHMNSGPSMCLVTRGEDTIRTIKFLIGPQDPEQAHKSHSMSIRSLFGTNLLKNAISCSKNVQHANTSIQALFPTFQSSRASFSSESPAPLFRNRSNTFGNRSDENKRTSFINKPLYSESEEEKPRTSAEKLCIESQLLESKPRASQEKLPFETPIVEPKSNLPIERTLAFIKPDAYSKGSKDLIISKIKAEEFSILYEREMILDLEQAKKLYQEHEGKLFFDDLCVWISSSPIYILVLEKSNGVFEWRKLCGPTDPVEARSTDPKSIRAIYGTDNTFNAVHGSDSLLAALLEIELLCKETLVAVIKPDAFGAGYKDAIISRIKSEGFRVVQERETIMSLDNAKELYRSHVDKPYYTPMVDWMCSAPAYFMVLEKGLAVLDWQTLAGPVDPEEAKKVAPNSLRATYGTNTAYNAIRASHSNEEGLRDREIMFPPNFNVEPNIPIVDETIPDTVEEILIPKVRTNTGSRTSLTNSPKGSQGSLRSKQGKMADSKSQTSLNGSKQQFTSSFRGGQSLSNLNSAKTKSQTSLNQTNPRVKSAMSVERIANVVEKRPSTSSASLRKPLSLTGIDQQKPEEIQRTSTSILRSKDSIKKSTVSFSQEICESDESKAIASGDYIKLDDKDIEPSVEPAHMQQNAESIPNEEETIQVVRGQSNEQIQTKQEPAPKTSQSSLSGEFKRNSKASIKEIGSRRNSAGSINQGKVNTPLSKQTDSRKSSASSIKQETAIKADSRRNSAGSVKASNGSIKLNQESTKRTESRQSVSRESVRNSKGSFKSSKEGPIGGESKQKSVELNENDGGALSKEGSALLKALEDKIKAKKEMEETVPTLEGSFMAQESHGNESPEMAL